MIERMVPSLYVENLTRSVAFYRDLLGLTPVFHADWIVQLADPENNTVELMLQPRDHELVPVEYQMSPQGCSLVFVVPDCDAVFEQAQTMKLTIVQPPKNEVYGQRRFLTADPDGVLIDISSTCEPSPEFVAKYFG